MRERILAQNPEVVCLTEAYLDFWLEPGHMIAAEEDYGYPIKAGRRKVILWSKRPWENVEQRPSPTMPPGRYVYGETETSLGILGIHGVCIPWSGAHVTTGMKNRQRWQDHLAYLAALPAALDKTSCAQQLMAGDFNQRVPRKYTPHHVYEAMQTVLDGRLTILTIGSISPIEKQTIDHIAVSGGLKAAWIKSLANTDPQGRAISDHFGICVNLELIPG